MQSMYQPHGKSATTATDLDMKTKKTATIVAALDRMTKEKTATIVMTVNLKPKNATGVAELAEMTKKEIQR